MKSTSKMQILRNNYKNESSLTVKEKTTFNLKCVNKFVKYKHFIMESLKDVFKIIKQVVWMANVDLKHAFFYSACTQISSKFLKFEWFKGLLGMLNRYSEAMRIFTEILEPILGHLKQEGHIC